MDLSASKAKIASAFQVDLVDLRSVHSRIQIELKYATDDNFTGQRVYAFEECYLRREVAEQLSKVQNELEAQGLGLKVWDGYRPLAAQHRLWEIVPDERYVATPTKGGRHTRGTAVDVTLVNSQGEELEMPSAFDDFSERAHRNYPGASAETAQNRDFLQQVMEKQGFIGLETEWWHFDYRGWENFPPLESAQFQLSDQGVFAP